MAANRTCGSCHMCCRVFPIPEADKLHTDWCAKLQIGKGCRIYERRPKPCRDFRCLWLLDESLGEEWRPDTAGFVLSDPDPWALLVTNDPDNPQAWRRPPYESRIRAWADEASARGFFAGVREAQTLLLLLGANEKVIEGA
jgi:hypothetical protein